MNSGVQYYRLSENGEKIISTKNKAFALPQRGKGYRAYIDALICNADDMSPSDIVSGADTVATAMIEDIINLPDTIKASGTTYYISPRGDDKNDGLTPETAWATTQKLKDMSDSLLKGDAVLFERGGIWRKPPSDTLDEHALFTAMPGVSYGAYGEGRKPRLYGSTRNYADPAFWEKTEYPNIYKCTVHFKNAGIVALDHSEKLGRYDERVAFKEIVGLRGFNGIEDLRFDCSYYHQCEEQVIYFCSEQGNPGERFDSIEIGGRQSVIKIDNAEIIENFEIKFDGYGVSAARYLNPETSMNLRGCIFSYLGGCLGTPITGRTTICGNAVEIYGPCNGFAVESCWMYQLCDTGLTHQLWIKSGECVQKNITFIGNVIEYCHWAIEFNNPPAEDGSLRLTENLNHSYNVLRHGGEGFGSVYFNRKERGTLYNCFGTDKAVNCVCEKNILCTSAGPLYRMRFEGDKNIKFKNNLNIQTAGKKFASLFDKEYYSGQGGEEVLCSLTDQQGSVFIAKE